MKAATANCTISIWDEEFQSTPPVKAATLVTGVRKAESGFQSTPPVKAATHFCSNGDADKELISIHAAREGGDGIRECRVNILLVISIHAAREGGDPSAVNVLQVSSISIHAAREGGDVARNAEACCKGLISIHAAREGGDRRLEHKMSELRDFNPRRP